MSTVSTSPSADGMPTRTVSDTLGYVGAGGEAFPYHRLEVRWPASFDPENAVTYPIGIPLRGELEVTRGGQDGSGPWGVDLYRDSMAMDVVLTPAEARTWAHALLGAADLADRFNSEGVQA